MPLPSYSLLTHVFHSTDSNPRHPAAPPHMKIRMSVRLSFDIPGCTQTANELARFGQWSAALLSGQITDRYPISHHIQQPSHCCGVIHSAVRLRGIQFQCAIGINRQLVTLFKYKHFKRQQTMFIARPLVQITEIRIIYL